MLGRDCESYAMFSQIAKGHVMACAEHAFALPSHNNISKAHISV
jgi:hypothetical protein